MEQGTGGWQKRQQEFTQTQAFSSSDPCTLGRRSMPSCSPCSEAPHGQGLVGAIQLHTGGWNSVSSVFTAAVEAANQRRCFAAQAKAASEDQGTLFLLGLQEPERSTGDTPLVFHRNWCMHATECSPPMQVLSVKWPLLLHWLPLGSGLRRQGNAGRTTDTFV